MFSFVSFYFNVDPNIVSSQGFRIYILSLVICASANHIKTSHIFSIVSFYINVDLNIVSLQRFRIYVPSLVICVSIASTALPATTTTK